MKQKNYQAVLKYGPSLSVVVSLISCPLIRTSFYQLRGAFMGILMMYFLHCYLKYAQPLFVQGIMDMKNLYDPKFVALYIFSRPVEGDLERPFKNGGGIFGATAGEPQQRMRLLSPKRRRE